MFKYDYERIKSDLSGFGLINGSKYQSRDYQKIILERSKSGWRYVGFIPSVQRATGHIQEMDLIFEKEE